MRCPIQQACLESPERILFRTATSDITMATFAAMVDRADLLLQAAGLAAGDRLVIQLAPEVTYFSLIFAAIRRQIVICPLSQRLSEEQFAARCEELSPRMIVREPLASLAGDSQPTDQSVDLESVEFDDEAMAFILYTSGSSGTPKGACLSFKNLWLNARGAMDAFPFAPGDSWLLSLPLHHVGGWGIVFRALVARGSIYLLGEGERPASSLSRVTHVSCVPTQLSQWMSDGLNLGHLKGILVGGAAPAKTLIEEGARRSLALFRTYGCTEMGSQITRTRPNASLDELMSEGTLLPYREMQLDDDGAIRVRGETLFLGYWHRGEVKSPCKQGWYHTGDRGTYREGILRFAGRVDNLIISGGENIQPEEIEAALKRIPPIQDAIVVGRDDPHWGQRPVAFVLTPGKFDVEGWRNTLSQQLERFKVPETFHPWPDFGTDSMKISRHQFADHLTRLLQ